MAVRDPFAALGFTETLLICGGSDKDNQTRKNCYSLLSGAWVESTGFNFDNYLIWQLFQLARLFTHSTVKLAVLTNSVITNTQ